MKHRARTVTLAAVIVVGLGAAPLAQAQDAWIVYQNADFHFTADVPALPNITLSTDQSAAGPEPTLQGTIEMSPVAALQLTAVDLTNLKADIDPNAVLEGGVNGGVNAAKATIDSETTVTDGAAIGRDAIYHNANLKYETRIFYLNRRVVAITGLGDGKVPAEFERAARSLKISP